MKNLILAKMPHLHQQRAVCIASDAVWFLTPLVERHKSNLGTHTIKLSVHVLPPMSHKGYYQRTTPGSKTTQAWAVGLIVIFYQSQSKELHCIITKKTHDVHVNKLSKMKCDIILHYSLCVDCWGPGPCLLWVGSSCSFVPLNWLLTWLPVTTQSWLEWSVVVY